MPLSPVTLGITAVIELIRFVQTSRELKGKTAEEVMEMWADTRSDVRATLDLWRAGNEE